MTPASGNRAGTFLRQRGGFEALVPSPFPPRDLDLSSLSESLERATLALGQLVGSTQILPDPDLFVFMNVRREAVLSSQIEGTEASLEEMDILVEITGKKSYRAFAFESYLELFEERRERG